MKLSRLIKYLLFSFIGGFFLPLVAYASSTDMPFNSNDINHNWGFVYRLLELLFGDYINKYGQTTDNIAGTSYTVITHLGFWSCWAAILLAIILISSAAVNAYRWADNPAKHLSNDTVLLLKFGMVIMLVFPIGLAGTSLAQNMGVIKTVLLGDSFANLAYSSTVKEMLVPPKLTNTNVDAAKIANKILKAEVCTWAVQKHSKSRNADLKNIFKDGSITPTPSSNDIIYTKNEADIVRNRYKSINIDSGTAKDTHKIMFAPQITYNGTALSAYCGTITFPESNSGKSVFDEVEQKQSLALKEAVINLTNNLNPAAQALFAISETGVKISDNADATTQQIASQIQSIYSQAITNYSLAVSKIPDSIKTNVLNDSALTTFIDKAGWGLGIIWWKLLADTQSSFIHNAADFTNSMSSKIMPICSNKGIWGIFGDQYCVDKAYYDELQSNILYVIKNSNAELANNPNLDKNSNSTAKFDEICSISGCSLENTESWLAETIKYILAKATGSQIYIDALSNNSLDKITKAENQESIFDASSNLGAKLVELSGTMLSLSLVSHTIAGILAGTGKTALGFFGLSIATGGAKAVADFVGNLLSNGSYALAIPANILLVVLPFIPIIIWGFLILSYLIMVVEAFIAVNLGMALWIVPDEIFMSGRVIRTVMMICSLFLRPFLFVVGLATSFALAPIALTIWNTLFFWGSSYLTTSNFITALFLVVIYTAGLVKFTMVCYNVSFVLPDKILQWMGSGYGDVASFGSHADFGSTVSSFGGMSSMGRGVGGEYQQAVTGLSSIKKVPSAKPSAPSGQSSAAVTGGVASGAVASTSLANTMGDNASSFADAQKSYDVGSASYTSNNKDPDFDNDTTIGNVEYSENDENRFYEDEYFGGNDNISDTEVTSSLIDAIKELNPNINVRPKNKE